MRTSIALSLVVSIGLLIMAVAPATAKDKGPPGALMRDGFMCLIDLEDVVGEVQDDGIVSTFDSDKLCTPSGRISIECRAEIDEWMGGNVNVRNIPCQMFPCDGGDLLTADRSQVHINNQGKARLMCDVMNR